ncbi:hypothetical protein [Geopseudomonas aromaticivorans]
MSIAASKGWPGRLAWFRPWHWVMLLTVVTLLWQAQALHLDQRL